MFIIALKWYNKCAGDNKTIDLANEGGGGGAELTKSLDKRNMKQSMRKAMKHNTDINKEKRESNSV
jgi:hypothetical protein